MNKQRHDVGHREFRPRTRIDERANALARHQRYDSGGSGPSRVSAAPFSSPGRTLCTTFLPGIPVLG